VNNHVVRINIVNCGAIYGKKRQRVSTSQCKYHHYYKHHYFIIVIIIKRYQNSNFATILSIVTREGVFIFESRRIDMFGHFNRKIPSVITILNLINIKQLLSYIMFMKITSRYAKIGNYDPVNMFCFVFFCFYYMYLITW